MAGMAAADENGHIEVNVGFEGAAGRSAALDAASEVKREFAFDAVTIEVPEQAIQGLESNPNVRYVEENGEMHALGDTVPYGIDLVEAIDAHDKGYRGDGASIAIIDTGIESNHESLPNVVGGAAFDQCSTGSFACWFGGNGNPCNEDWDDDHDHGTHCAGTAAAPDNGVGVVGVAPDADLYAVKVLTCTGGGSFSDIAAGIEWTADQGIDVGSMSLGGSSSNAVEDAVEYADDHGVLLVAAAGNDGCGGCVSYPAAYDEVMAVSATDENDTLASFSSYGPEIEIAAPGVDVLSTVAQSDYDEFSGTSMACPHVAGAGAILMAEGRTADQARQLLKDGADDIGLPSDQQGDGRLNVADSVDLL